MSDIYEVDIGVNYFDNKINYAILVVILIIFI